VCTEPDRRNLDNGVEVLPIADFCKALWNSEFDA
jgi:hypothetical protein